MNPESTAAHSPLRRRAMLSICFGTFLEWYDFLTFASLVTYFGVLFYPPDRPVAALLASLATFGVGMLVRPLGALVFGSLGDRHGRRVVFITTLVLMGVATFGVGMLPTYSQIGLGAPILLLLLRLLQGFAAGGEIGGAGVYLAEHAPADRRGFFTCGLQLMGPLGIMASTAQIVALQAWLPEADFKAWGWRIPFLLSALLLLISLKSRVALYESPIFTALRQRKALATTPFRDCLRDRVTRNRMLLLFFCLSAGGSLLFFSSQVYLTVFLKNVVRLDPTMASGLVLASTLALFPMTLFFGWLSDHVGRRPVTLAGLLLGCLLLIPVAQGLLHYGNPALAQFNHSVPVQIWGANCDYNGWTEARNACERTQAQLPQWGVAYQVHPQASDVPLQVQVGQSTRLHGENPAVLHATLEAAGWPAQADASQVRWFPMLLLLLLPALAYVLATAPQTATFAELFPTRSRYSAVGVPHNLSAGWIGGLSPLVVTMLNVKFGVPGLGLWYVVAMLALAFLVGFFFMPETRHASLSD